MPEFTICDARWKLASRQAAQGASLIVIGKSLASISTEGLLPVEGVQKVRFSRAFSV